ncbi:TetR/AcrR family transcriptional regulator [Solimonas sp. K1W22B-7]|uniref:TetR/AcrR family transcriptional regulator n=1 Tax=Solimonas sp. K1W22B-7 TaxID=2303331 RepID=UPI000E330BB9|nr:TetR/AcrR family transcriptional regulator [Solimonas sp. K1W22B-7]AXQ30195.1 TetR/AcrR family transcriptional regulator [Solimonas sp. K1W22B-7]
MTAPVKSAQTAVPAARGRPRNPQTRVAILRAARELMEQGGPAAVTMEAVAARAGVGKPTVYRWWPDRHAVSMAALMEVQPDARPARRARSVAQALQQQLAEVVDTFATRTGRNVATMIAAADSGTELSKAFRNHFVLARREEGRRLLLEGIAAGELRRDLELEAALDLLYGPLFFRLLLGHAPLDAAFAKQLLKDWLRGCAAARERA